jgi:dihydrofolate reductase
MEEETHDPSKEIRFAAVAAMADNRVIGLGNKLPWHLPEDFKWFKRLTRGTCVVMGRKTFESLKGPLPHRRNLVLSRTMDPAQEGVEIARSADEVRELTRAEPRVFVIGGAEIYQLLLPWCREFFLTRVHGEFEGDAFLPPFESEFPEAEEIFRTPSFTVWRYSRAAPSSPPPRGVG